jgi:hypothetical protein
MKKESRYKTEAELCAAFIEWVQPMGWTSYNECCGWDILLAHPDGRQFGIQAKLRFNATLFRQVMPSLYEKSGPDHRGVLLPESGECIDPLNACGVAVIHCYSDGFAPDYFSGDNCAPEGWNPAKRHELPEFVPDVPAGASCPVQLTTWKIAALRVCELLERQGYLTAKEIKEFGIDARRWTNPATKWLQPHPDGAGKWVRGPRLEFDRQHPDVYAKIKAGGATVPSRPSCHPEIEQEEST